MTTISSNETLLHSYNLKSINHKYITDSVVILGFKYFSIPTITMQIIKSIKKFICQSTNPYQRVTQTTNTMPAVKYLKCKMHDGDVELELTYSEHRSNSNFRSEQPVVGHVAA
jgi:hypothetical protein